jgi:hypothetical protein
MRFIRFFSIGGTVQFSYDTEEWLREHYSQLNWEWFDEFKASDQLGEIFESVDGCIVLAVKGGG